MAHYDKGLMEEEKNDPQRLAAWVLTGNHDDYGERMPFLLRPIAKRIEQIIRQDRRRSKTTAKESTDHQQMTDAEFFISSARRLGLSNAGLARSLGYAPASAAVAASNIVHGKRIMSRQARAALERLLAEAG